MILINPEINWNKLSNFILFEEISRFLLDRHADLSVLTKLEETVLHGAVYGNQPAIVNMLIKEGEYCRKQAS